MPRRNVAVIPRIRRILVKVFVSFSKTMIGFDKDCAMHFATALTACTLAFSAPFAVGGEGLIEDRVWQVAGASGSARTLRSFVASFPDSPLAEEAEARIRALTEHVHAASTYAGGHRYVQ